MKIAIVEDEIRIREGIITLLQRIGPFEIVGVAANGREGLLMIEEKRPELIITDIKLPSMSGLEMLESLKEKKIKYKAIILSAFSEFEYAQKGISLGVSEYLVKPISLDSFTRAINTVKKQIEKSRLLDLANPQQLSTLENVLFGLTYGSLSTSVEINDFLISNYSIDVDDDFLIFYVYQTDDFLLERCKNLLSSRLEKKKRSYCVLPFRERQGLAFFLYNTPDIEEQKEYLKKVLVPELYKIGKDNVLFYWEILHSLHDLKDRMEELWKSLDWGISYPPGTILERETKNQEEYVHLNYPMELETKAKVIICSRDNGAFTKNIDDAYCHFTAHFHAPNEIRENMIRYVTSLYHILSDTGGLSTDSLEYSSLIENISSSKTKKELKISFSKIRDYLDESCEVSDYSLPIKQVERIIYEQYDKGISLFEIAEKLNMTPGYLGSLFHKETGVSFNNFLKQYRLQKAKTLLIETNEKLISIAKSVGFSDAKYLSKTFKEKTGMLPAEYRRINR